MSDVDEKLIVKLGQRIKCGAPDYVALRAQPVCHHHSPSIMSHISNSPIVGSRHPFPPKKPKENRLCFNGFSRAHAPSNVIKAVR